MSSSSPFHVRLESERVKLVPFEVPKHASLLIDANPPDSLYGLTLLGPFNDVDHFKTSFWTPVIEAHPDGACAFAVYDKTRAVEGQDEDSMCFAGIIGLLRTSFVNLSTEIAGVVILPAFQRTHVTSNAVGLLMQFALDLPDNEDGHPGLGMRRVVWTASTANPNSVSTAKRMGFQQEGIMRWDRVLPEHRAKGGNGKPVRQGDPKENLTGRDTVVLSVCWDDWEGGVRRQTIEAMNRKS